MTRLAQAQRPVPTQLPSTIAELEQYRGVGPERTLNDFVEQIFRRLWDESEAFRLLLEATGDDDTVEGSMSTDNVFAAKMIRDYAIEHHHNEVARRKAHAIVRALKVVMNRYNMSRKIRARVLGGEVVPPDADSNGD